MTVLTTALYQQQEQKNDTFILHSTDNWKKTKGKMTVVFLVLGFGHCFALILLLKTYSFTSFLFYHAGNRILTYSNKKSG